MITLEALNGLPPAAFAATLGEIFEHSPWVAARAAAARPFTSRLELLDAMRAVVQAAPCDEQVALIRAHPQLGARGRTRTTLTAASAGEQRRAGLDACSDAEFAQLLRLNAAYVEKFSFPFILAVRGHDPSSILAAIGRRLEHDAVRERETALLQIGSIAGYRLADLVASAAGVEILAMTERLAQAVAADGSGAELVREWMLAAGLEVHMAQRLIGIQRSEPDARQVLIGVHYDCVARRVRSDGRLGFLVGIAVAQQLRQRGVRVPFDLVILARPADEDSGSVAMHAEPDAIRGCTALAAADFDALPELRLAGVAAPCLVLVRQGPAGVAYRADAPLEAASLSRAAQSLETFLLQGEPSHGRRSGAN